MKNCIVIMSLFATALPLGALAQSEPAKQLAPANGLLPPFEARLSFDGQQEGSDLVLVEPADTHEIPASIVNTSEKLVHVVGVGYGPTTLSPVRKTLRPGERLPLPVVIATPFAAYPVSVNWVAVYKVEGDTAMRLSSARVRLALRGMVIPSTDRLLWKSSASDEREVKLSIPAGVSVKAVRVQGDFEARLEGSSVFVRPIAPTGTTPAVTMPEGVKAPTVPAVAARRTTAFGQLILVLDPAPKLRLASISLTAAP